MSTKAAFMTAMGGAKIPFGPVKEFTRSSGNVLTVTGHGLDTGAGPYKVLTSNGDAPAGLVAAVRASGTLTASTVIATDRADVDGKEYTFQASPSVNGDVDLGGSDVESMSNLAHAVNSTPNAGSSTYDPATTGGNRRVLAVADGSVLTVFAQTLDASIGNTIPIASPDVTITASGATLASGVDGTDYFVIRLTEDTFSLATSRANALAGTAQAVTDAGSGVHTLVPTVETLAAALEDVVNNTLTGKGSRVLPADFNQGRFWQAAIDGVAAGEQT